MARTFKKKPPNPYKKEDKFARKQTNRKFRRDSKQINPEIEEKESNLPEKPQHTCGWLTH